MEATLEWNAEDPAASALTATVRADSVDTDDGGDTDFDGEIAANVLDASETPEIRFTSTRVEMAG